MTRSWAWAALLFCLGVSPAACTSGLSERSALPAPPDVAASESPAEPPSTLLALPAEELPTSREEPAPEPPELVTHPFHATLPDAVALASGPANELAKLSPALCQKRLAAEELAVERWRGPAPGIATPLRINGPLGGVQFRVPSPRTPFGLLDCRLALTLRLLSDLLLEHDVVQIRIDNFYRPRARLPRRKKPSQHAHGLAADVVEFVLRDGEVLNVERDFQGRRGDPPCGPEARLIEETERAVRLRNLVCAVAARGLFHHILTPNYDAAHRDHLHLDIKRDEKWFGVR